MNRPLKWLIAPLAVALAAIATFFADCGDQDCAYCRHPTEKDPR